MKHPSKGASHHYGALSKGSLYQSSPFLADERNLLWALLTRRVRLQGKSKVVAGIQAVLSILTRGNPPRPISD